MGLFNTVTYLVKNLVGVVIVKGLQFCMTDEVLAVTATLSATGGDIMWGFASSDWMLYAGGVSNLNQIRVFIRYKTINGTKSLRPVNKIT